MNLNQISNIAQIITGIASVLVAFFAYRATGKISSQQHDIAVKTNRAYLIPEQAKLMAFEIGKPVEAILLMKNWGHTPALQVRSTFRSYFANAMNNEMTGVPLEIEQGKAEITVPPQGQFALGRIGREGEPLTDSLLRRLKSGETIFFCDFIAEYRDLNGGAHATFIRYFLKSDHIVDGTLPSLSHGHGHLSMT